MTRKVLNFQYDLGVKVSKGANNRNRYNQVPHLTQDTNGKVTHLHLTKHTNGKVANSQFSFVMSNCDVVTFPLVSCVRCGA